MEFPFKGTGIRKEVIFFVLLKCYVLKCFLGMVFIRFCLTLAMHFGKMYCHLFSIFFFMVNCARGAEFFFVCERPANSMGFLLIHEQMSMCSEHS